MSNVCANIEPILDCAKKHTNTKSTLEEKIKVEKLKYKQIRERHRLRDQLKEERSSLIPKLPRSFERLLHLLIKQAILKRPPKISTFFSQLLEKLVDCRIKQELGLSSSRADPFKDYTQSFGEDADKDDLAVEYIARRLAAGSQEPDDDSRLQSARQIQAPVYSTSKVATPHPYVVQTKAQPLLRTASRQRSTITNLKPTKPVSPPAVRSGISSKASSAPKSTASKHTYKQTATQPPSLRSSTKAQLKISPASKSPSAVRTKAQSQSSQTSKSLPHPRTVKMEMDIGRRLGEEEKKRQRQEVKEIEEIGKETHVKSNVHYIS